MANFDDQIRGLTSLTISSSGTSPTEAELTQFLTDGAKEVINSLPNALQEKCMTATGVGTDFKVDLDGLGEVLYVPRENADAGYLVPCREIPSMYGGLATDESSLHYATVTDPVYWIDGDNSGAATLYVKPTPSTNQPAIVHHVAYPTIVGSDDSVVANFPDELEYLVVLYAAIKIVERQLVEEEDIELYIPIIATLKQDYMQALQASGLLERPKQERTK